MRQSRCLLWLCCLVFVWGVGGACELTPKVEAPSLESLVDGGQSEAKETPRDVSTTTPEHRDGPPSAEPATSEPVPELASQSKVGRARLPGSLLAANWIDVHTHCDIQEIVSCPSGKCCNVARWRPVAQAGGAAVIASTEHFHIVKHNKDPLPDLIKFFPTDQINEIVEASVAKAPGLGFFISLDCWHADKLVGDGKAWAEACKRYVDQWVARGAIGFKDHIGKQFNNEGGTSDYARWLGGWNRFNGFCQPPAGTSAPNQTCMEKEGVRYPALEPAWREVIRYITEVKKLPILTHATSYYTASERCWDPLAKTQDKVRSCAAANQEHLRSLATWLKDNLSAKARSRVIMAHLGFLQEAPALLEEVMKAGLSTEIAVGVAFLSGKTCQLRQLIAAYPKQIMFGTDINIDRECSAINYQAWSHLLTGAWKQPKSFNICFAKQPVPIYGADLDQKTVTGCAADLPEGTLNDLLKENFLRLFDE